MALLAEVYEKLGDEGLPGINSFENPTEETEITPPIEASQEELAKIFDTLVKMGGDKSTVSDDLTANLTGRLVKIIRLPNLPDRERWQALQSTEAELTVTPNLKKPVALELKLDNFTTSGFGTVILGWNHPLCSVKAITIEKKDNNFTGKVVYRVDEKDGEIIRRDSRSFKGYDSSLSITSTQAISLLGILSKPQISAPESLPTG
ncbi:hypothetical protein HY030_02595 [Candidatus Gottesmanbacteria bacterium]|nr:hypothetical protein [Candidatus Gottesmanbacteria bacterium]